jgi:hypothetical protein
MENYLHQHDNVYGNSSDRKAGLIQKRFWILALSPVIGRISFSVIESFGENSVRLYRDGRQIFESPQEVHKRGGL